MSTSYRTQERKGTGDGGTCVLSDLIDLEKLDVTSSSQWRSMLRSTYAGNLQEQISPRWNVTREAAAQMLVVNWYSESEWGRGREGVRNSSGADFVNFEDSTA